METTADTAVALFDAINRHDLDAAAALWQDDVVEDLVALGTFSGKQGARAYFEEMFAAVPDFALEIINIVSDDATAVVQWRATGTFNGAAFQGIRATGRPVDLRGVDVMQMRDGKLQRNTIYHDGLAFARQIGLLPAEGSLPDHALMAAFNARTRALGLLRRG